MKQTITITSFSLLLISLSSKAQNLKTDTVEIKKVVADFFEVFSQNDMQFAQKNSVPEFELYEQGVLWNMDSIAHYVNEAKKQNSPWKRSNYFSYLTFNVKENTAWAGYYNTAIFTNPSDPSRKFEVKWLESVILVKKKGKWLLEQMHSTRIDKK